MTRIRYRATTGVRAQRQAIYESLSMETRALVEGLALCLRDEIKLRGGHVMFGLKDAEELAVALLQFLIAKGQV